jgi:hypothetical protein
MADSSPITIQQLGRLTDDDSNNKLYWDGKPVVTEQQVILTKLTTFAVFSGGVGTLLLAVLEVLKFFGVKYSG